MPLGFFFFFVGTESIDNCGNCSVYFLLPPSLPPRFFVMTLDHKAPVSSCEWWMTWCDEIRIVCPHLHIAMTERAFTIALLTVLLTALTIDFLCLLTIREGQTTTGGSFVRNIYRGEKPKKEHVLSIPIPFPLNALPNPDVNSETADYFNFTISLFPFNRQHNRRVPSRDQKPHRLKPQNGPLRLSGGGPSDR